jgi:cytochrome c oxidase subunit II
MTMAPSFRRLVLLAPLAILGGCSGPLSTLEPAGPSAQAIANLWWFILAFTSVIFFLMSAVLIVAAVWPERLRVYTPRQLIVWGGIVMPTVGLTAMVGYAVYLGEQIIPRADADSAVRIEVVAQQFFWEFAYPDAPDGMEARSEHVLHIPAGEEVHLHITSRDVIHSFWVPRLAGKVDAVPGHVNVLRLVADVPGTYGGVCAEYCGVGHAPMIFTVEAHDPADYPAAIAALAGGLADDLAGGGAQ